MKKAVIILALATTAITAHAQDISQSAGICGAYYYAKNDMYNAKLALQHAENRGKMQVAAQKWIKLAQENPKAAYQEAAYSCAIKLRMNFK